MAGCSIATCCMADHPHNRTHHQSSQNHISWGIKLGIYERYSGGVVSKFWVTNPVTIILIQLEHYQKGGYKFYTRVCQ